MNTEWTDAKLRGIASDYFTDAKDWPAAMNCLRHLLMEQAAKKVRQLTDSELTDGWDSCARIENPYDTAGLMFAESVMRACAGAWGLKLDDMAVASMVDVNERHNVRGNAPSQAPKP